MRITVGVERSFDEQLLLVPRGQSFSRVHPAHDRCPPVVRRFENGFMPLDEGDFLSWLSQHHGVNCLSKLQERAD